MRINFKEIPGYHKLFLDYLYDFEKVKKFYFYNFRDKEKYAEVFQQIYKRENDRRLSIKSIIKNQYSNYTNVSEKTLKNIDLISDKKTLFIITGQQIGILGGPLYTFYKILTAIKLSSHLNERFDNYYFVPIFWMESDDHDFKEVNSINILNDGNNLLNIRYKEDFLNDEFRQSVGTLTFDEAINNVFSKLENELRNTEFKESLLSRLKEIYKPGKTFSQSYRELLLEYFDCYGLLVFDPQDTEVKKLLKPIFIKEIKNFKEHTEKLVSISAELEDNYHAQVKIKPVNLFYTIDNGRYSIYPDENIFKLKRKRKQFSFDEILSEIENYPEKFSPNVILRPIVQDYLFNTAFYIAGPNEIAYFAQVNPLYKVFDLTPPIIFPRSSTTLFEKQLNKFLEKYNIDIKEIFSSQNQLKEKIVNKISEINISSVFNNSNVQMNLIFDELKENLFAIDKNLSDAVEKYREKSLQIIRELENKSNKFQEMKFETVLLQLGKLLNFLYPNGNLQERELNFVYFYNKYGHYLMDKIFEELSIQDFEHQIIYL